MAGYNEIKGLRVKYLSDDPSNAEDGQVWYNSTSGNLRVQGIGLQSVTSGSPLITARNGLAGAGIQTAALAFGGDVSPPPTTLTEEYNGSGWSAGGAMNQARTDVGGTGTQTAALGFGGYNPPPGAVNNSEEYNGSSWTAGNNINTARYRLVGLGTQTAAMALGGRGTPEPQPVVATVENYDGTNWTTGTSFSTARQAGGAAGINTAGLICGGGATPVPAGTTNTANSEEWNGTSWTEGNNMNTTKRAFAGQNGLQTAAIMMGGAPNTTGIETYDGTSWSVSPATLVTQRHNGSGTSGAPGTTGLAVGGSADPGPTASTEEYNSSLNTFTAAAWASGGALGTARYQMGGAGDLPSGLAYGGYSTGIGSNTNKTEEYNGTSWAEQNDMSNPRGQCSGQHIGTQTAALAAGGTLPGSPNYGSACEEYNGTSWTAGGALTEDSGRSYVAGFGTQTAGVAAGGYAQTGATSNSEEYDGSSWTAGNNRNNPASASSGTGTQTAGLAVGIYPNSSNVEEYDGTDWTNVTAYPSGRFGVFGGMGTQTDSMHAGGSSGTTRTAAVFGYDGTSFSTKPSLANALSSGASGGTSSSAFIAGGRGSPPGPTAGVTTTEEFTGETSAVAPASTITTS